MKRFSLPQVLVIVASIFLVGTIVPSLLDAKSDVSILIAVMIVVSIFYGTVTYGKKLMKWMDLDLDEDEDKTKKEKK